MTNEPKSLLSILRESASERPTFTTGEWILTESGIQSAHPGVAVCAAHDPGCGEFCPRAIIWVVENSKGFYPACLTHIGEAVKDALFDEDEDGSLITEATLIFHLYVGKAE